MSNTWTRDEFKASVGRQDGLVRREQAILLAWLDSVSSRDLDICCLFDAERDGDLPIYHVYWRPRAQLEQPKDYHVLRVRADGEVFVSWIKSNVRDASFQQDTMNASTSILDPGSKTHGRRFTLGGKVGAEEAQTCLRDLAERRSKRG